MDLVEIVGRKVSLAALVLAVTFSPGILAADVKQMFLDDSEVSVTRVMNPVFDGIFDERIYDVEYTVLSSNERFSPSYDYRVYSNGERLVPIYDPGSNSDLNYFDDLIDPQFRLDEKTADRFRSALRALLPDGFFESVDADEIRNKGNQWYFLTGEFFDHYKGFVVTVGDGGAVESVGYQLKLIPTGSD